MNLVEDVPHEAREANIFTTVGEVPKAAAISVPRTLSDGSRSEMLLGLCCSQRSIASIYLLSIRGVSQSRGLTGTEKTHPISIYPVKTGHCKCFPSKCTSEL
jgi:hypothetical protein